MDAPNITKMAPAEADAGVSAGAGSISSARLHGRTGAASGDGEPGREQRILRPLQKLPVCLQI